MKKVFGLVVASSLVLGSLSACGTSDKASTASSEKKQEVTQEKKTDSDQEKKIDEEVAKLSKWESIKEIGKMKQIGFGYNDELGIDGSDKPLKPYKFGDLEFYVENMTVALIKPNDKGSALFNSYNDQKAILLSYKLKNNSNYKTDFESENLEITTPNGDKISPMNNLSTYFGINRFIKPHETVKGIAWFVFDDNKEKINKVLLYVDSPTSTDVNANRYDGKTFNFKILNVRESVINDLKK